MMRNKRLWLSVIGVASLLVAITALAIYLITAGLEETFTGSVTWLAHAFADEVSHHLSMANQDKEVLQNELAAWAEQVVQEYLLYAQVVQDGKALAEAKAPQAINLKLDVGMPSVEMSATQGQLPDGTAYLDLVKTLELSDGSSDSESYLRMGISLTRVRVGTQMASLILGLAGLLGIFLSFLLMLYLDGQIVTRASTPVPAPALASASATVVGNGQGGDNSLWEIGKLVIDDGQKEVRINGRSAKLTPREYAVLRVLASEPQKVFSDEEIISQVWSGSPLASADDVRKYIRFLRKKLEENPTNPQVIITVKGFGYKLQT